MLCHGARHFNSEYEGHPKCSDNDPIKHGCIVPGLGTKIDIAMIVIRSLPR